MTRLEMCNRVNKLKTLVKFTHMLIKTEDSKHIPVDAGVIVWRFRGKS